MKTKAQAVKKGRPVGSVSFTEVRLAELIERYKPDQILPVSRVFLTKPQPAATEHLVTVSAKITNVPLEKAQASMETIRHAFEDGPNAPKVEMALSE